MGLISWLVFGGLVGWIASIIMGKSRRMGLGKNIICGILGSFIGGWLGNLVGVGGGASFTKIGFITSIIGACLFIWLIDRLSHNR